MKYCLFNIAFWGLLFFNLFEAAANSNIYTISGRVTEAKTNSPLPGASILIKGTYLWAVSNQKGEFTIQGVQEGKYNLEVSFLGYVPATNPVNVRSNINNLPIILKENTLALDDVVVTAQAPKNELNTTLTIGNHALEHLQVSNVSDISALLPGGKTKVPDLTTNNIFSLRDGGSTAGNAAFGTAVEVDGVRIGNNGSFGNMSGVDTRNITVADIESVEVITGVPSAEYGDLNSGMVKIHTRKGKTPWNILLSINPRTEQVSFAKGLDLGNNKGVININGEWTKATQKLVSPYSSYTRRGFSAGYSNTFRNVLRFDIGVTGNIGGMNTKDDPDAYSGEYNKVRDNVFRTNTSLAWLLNKSWITNLKFDASIYYNDNNSHAHTFYSYASEQPAVHATEEGYFMANKLPYTYFADQIIDSKELDYAASLKYEWNRRFKTVNSNLKAGVQWKATGNVGEGEYYKDPSLAPNGYRPRPYTTYPYMHNVSLYAEESLSEFVLDGINVTALGYEKNNLDTPADTVIYTGEQLKETGAGDVANALKYKGGVYFTNMGPHDQNWITGSSQINLRGIDGGTLVLINGVPASFNNVNHLDMLNLDEVERVEIVKGGGALFNDSELVDGHGPICHIMVYRDKKGKYYLCIKREGNDLY